VPRLEIRWSEPEASKPYARPFGVSFLADDGTRLGSVAVSGADLLYYRQFQAAVLALTGELFDDQELQTSADPQRAWLDGITPLLPPATHFEVAMESTFDHERGRLFHCRVSLDGQPAAVLDVAALLEYQEFQAAIAHQSGRLYRDRDVENVQDAHWRHAAWMRRLRECVQRPEPAEAMTAEWPWR
jgi:hypothetical protein